MRLPVLFLFVAASVHAAGLIATPSVVDWSYTAGSHNYPSQSVALVSSTGSTSYSATAGSENGWLLVNAAYVSSSATLSAGVYLTPGFQIDRLDNGSYQGTVNLTDGQGNTAAITVNLTITGGGGIPHGITVNPLSLSFTSAFSGSAQTQSVAVSGPTAGTLTVSSPSGTVPDWLQTVVTGAAGSFTLVVTAQPGTLAAGSYREMLVLSIGAASANLPVTLSIQAPSTLTVSPQALSFEFTQGDGPANPKVLLIGTTTGAGIPFAASSSFSLANWLSVTPPSGTAPTTLLVNAAPSSLAPGTYAGNVTISPLPGAPLTVPVSLTVRPQPVIGVSSGGVSFTYRNGEAVPPPVQLQVTGGGVAPTYTVQVTGGDWLSVTPASGVVPTPLTLSVHPAGLAPGAYAAQFVVTGTGSARGSATVSVLLQVFSAEMILSKVLHAASYQEGGIAPGEIVTLFGRNLAPAPLAGLALDAGGNVATTIGGVQVLFDGVPAPLIYTSGSQISAVAPYELAIRQETSVQVRWNGDTTSPLTLAVVPAAPGIFTADASGAGPAAALVTGDTVTLYVTGEGQTVPAGVTGKVTVAGPAPPTPPVPVLPVGVVIGSQVADITFKGESPGFVSGIMQLNVTIPRGLGPGTWPITVSVGGKSSQAGVTVMMK